LVAANQNKAPLKLFSLQSGTQNVQISPNEVYAIIKYKNGKTEKREFYYGTSFLSQSARFLKISDGMLSVEIFDNKGNPRLVKF